MQAQLAPRRFVVGINAVGIVLIVAPLLDVLLRILPPNPGAVSWRFGALGLLYNFLLLPLVGAAILLGSAVVLRRRGAARGLGAALVVIGALLGVSVLVFALDYLQMRGTIKLEARAGFDVAAGKAIAYAVLLAAATLLLGSGGVSAARIWAAEAARHRGEPVGLVVGQDG